MKQLAFDSLWSFVMLGSLLSILPTLLSPSLSMSLPPLLFSSSLGRLGGPRSLGRLHNQAPLIMKLHIHFAEARFW